MSVLKTWNLVEELVDSEENVKKYIFKKDDAIAEAVLYGYPDYNTRTVMCISVSCGCQVGCTFCGTGKFYGRTLTSDEIVEQVLIMKGKNSINFEDVKKAQIMFMSMGEPMINYNALSDAIIGLNTYFPNAQLLVSTSAPKGVEMAFAELNALASEIDQIGLQFSVHESTDEARKKLIPTNTSTERDCAIRSRVL